MAKPINQVEITMVGIEKSVEEKEARDTLSRVVIIQPALPTYRVKLFEMLAEEIPIQLVYSDASPEGVESVSGRLKCETVVVRELSLFGSVFWQRGVVRISASEKLSKLVVGGNPRYLSSVFALIIAKIRGVPVIMWGHSASSTSRAFGSIIRMQLMRLADVILLYYPEEIARLPKKLRGRAVGVDNSIDTKLIADVEQKITSSQLESIEREHELGDTPLLITIGRLTPKANVNLLIHSLAIVKERGFRAKLVVIGDGPELPALRQLASDLSVSESIIWVGEVYEEETIGVWMKSAAAFVYGGAVGLSLIHAFAYGLPAIISSDMDDHNPEALLFRDGVSGATFKRNDPDSLASTICQELGNPEDLRAKGENARRVAHDRLGIERMASRFLKVLGENESTAAT